MGANEAGTAGDEDGVHVEMLSGKSALAARHLFVVVHGSVAVVLDQFVALGPLEVFAHHFGDKFVEGGRNVDFCAQTISQRR